ncbi:helix-turn-helix domain-containing protein [Achromobacter xylosoxidans]
MPSHALMPAEGKRGNVSRFGAQSPTTDVVGAAELLKVHPKTILALIDEGAIPAAKVGRAYAMLVRDVLAYLEQSIIAQTRERMRAPTKAPRQGRTRAGSRTASSSAGSCAR